MFILDPDYQRWQPNTRNIRRLFKHVFPLL